MAALDDRSCHVNAPKGHSGPDEPSVGAKRAPAAAALARTASSRSSKAKGYSHDDNGDDGPVFKKAKLLNSGKSPAPINAKETVVALKGGEELRDRPRLSSPTDVSEGLSLTPWGSHAAQPELVHVRTLPLTPRGIADAARVLNASKSTAGVVGKENRQAGEPQTAKNNRNAPLLLSFPTETVYMLACCVKTASPRSVRKLQTRADSQTSLGSLSLKGSFETAGDGHINPPINQPYPSPSLEDIIHPSNASLDWMINHTGHSIPPTLFVCNKNHALNFCHFTKPKTFAIRPPSLSANGSSNGNSPVKPTKESSFRPLPVFGGSKGPSDAPKEPLTPLLSAALPAHAVSPATLDEPKLCAASFSEGREAFLRVASKFWPGPSAIYVRARTIFPTEKAPAYHLAKKASSSSIGSLPSLPSMGDLGGSASSPPSDGAAGVSILPRSVLIPATQLLGMEDDREGEVCFVGMRCPSHPLPRKILKEVYCGAAPSCPVMSYTPSSDSLTSMSSMDDSGESLPRGMPPKSGRLRTDMAVVGFEAPGPKSSVEPSSSTSAEDVDAALASMAQAEPTMTQRDKPGRVFVVNGEDNWESFSVPTCQNGEPNPVSLVIDGDNRTIHIVHHHPIAEGLAEKPGQSLISKDSVQRALLIPASPKRGTPYSFSSVSTNSNSSDASKNNIDRVITAVLSRWKIQEMVLGSNSDSSIN